MTENIALKGIGLDALFVDRDAVENGAWVEEIPGADGVKVLTKGWNCAEAIAMRDVQMTMRPPHLIDGTEEFDAAKKADPVGQQRQLTELQKRERAELLSRVLIKDWSGLGGIPFSQGNLDVICSNEAAMPARGVLFSAALKCGNMRGSREEAQLKNFVAGLGISFDSPASTTTQ